MVPSPFASADRAGMADVAAVARRRRVTAVASELASSMGSSREVAGAIHRAVELRAAQQLGLPGLARLAAEVWRAEAVPNSAARFGNGLEEAGEIVRVCELLDEQLEALPFETKSMDVILDELEVVVSCEGVRPELVHGLRGLRYRELEPAEELGRRLPVQARLAQRMFHRLGEERDYELHELETAAIEDAVLSGSLIQVANSALYSPEQRIGDVGHAIAYVGTAAARQVLLAAVMRPLYASAGLMRVWSHGLQMAQLCAALGRQTGLVEPGAAVLLGLVHDIGSLAVHMLPRDVVDRYHRLTEHGNCPSAYVEQLLFGCDHGEIGAGVLDAWSFPKYLVEAVRLHHQPERSGSMIAAMVYLAEFWSGLDEDLPSLVRLELCSKRTGLSLDSLVSVRVGKGPLDRLRAIA